MANEIIRGTTPTIIYTFDTVNVSDITSACLTIEQSGKIVVEKSLNDATVGEKTLLWTLTQTETLDFAKGNAQAMCNWLLANGTRGASKQMSITFEKNQKNEVMT